MFLVHELTHIVLSLIVGWILFRYVKSFWIYIVSFLGGFFLDADHLFDYFLYKKTLAFNYQEFIAGKYFDYAHKVILPLHSYELAIILLAIGALILFWHKAKATRKIEVIAFCLIAFGLSAFLHLLYDQVYYKPKPLTYSIIYRTDLGFDHDGLGFNANYEK